MEISVTQVSNGFIQSVRINRVMSPTDQGCGTGAEPNQFWMPGAGAKIFWMM